MDFKQIKGIGSFLKWGGGHIFFANIVSKLLSFSCSVAAIRLLTADSYGVITYALSVVLFLVPFMGGGSHFGILRFGPLQKSKSMKEKLYKMSLQKGSFFNILLFLILLTLAFLPLFDIEKTRTFILILSLQIFILFPFELIKSHFRILMKNRTYAYIDVVFYSFQIFLVFTLTPFYNEWGYIAALTLSPLITFIIYSFLNISNKTIDDCNQSIIEEGFWNYSLKASFGSSISRLLYVLDFFIIGLLISDPTQIAGYRSATIIPLSLSFVPHAYVTAHYIIISSKYQNKIYLKSFISDYWKIFIPLTIITIISLWFFASFIMSFFWGREYENFYPVFKILIIGIGGTFLFRLPFGNLLMGIGLSGKNLLVSIFTLVLNLMLNLLLIPKFGIIGAAWATTSSIWFSGLLAWLFFKSYVTRVPK